MSLAGTVQPFRPRVVGVQETPGTKSARCGPSPDRSLDVELKSHEDQSTRGLAVDEKKTRQKKEVTRSFSESY